MPFDPAYRYRFAFTHEGQQYSSPSQFTQAIVDTWQKEHPMRILLQYVDNLLCADDLPMAKETPESLLCSLAEQECKVIKPKVSCVPSAI